MGQSYGLDMWTTISIEELVHVVHSHLNCDKQVVRDKEKILLTVYGKYAGIDFILVLRENS